MRQMIVLASVMTLCSGASAQVLDQNFGGRTAPTGWRLEGAGRRVGDGPRSERGIEVAGDGESFSYWSLARHGLQPMSLYRITFEARTQPGSSPLTVVAGLDLCNRDFAIGNRWERQSFVFRTPERVAGSTVRLGQWHLRGAVRFRSVRIEPVAPTGLALGGAALGEGERVGGREYQCLLQLGGPASNESRALSSHTASFNSNRWVFGPESQVTYRHSVPGSPQRSARIVLNVNYRQSGALQVEMRRVGGPWVAVGRAPATGSFAFDAPSGLFPAECVEVRLRSGGTGDRGGAFAPGALQVDSYRYTAVLARPLPWIIGRTDYVRVAGPLSGVSGLDLRAPLADGRTALRLALSGPGSGRWPVRARLEARRADGMQRRLVDAAIQRSGRRSAAFPYTAPFTGEVQLRLSLTYPQGATTSVVTDVRIPEYLAADYGQLVPSAGACPMWWCDGTWKVHPGRAAPRERAPGGLIAVAAARGERRALQLVLRPAHDVGAVRVTVSPLRGPGGAALPEAAVEVRQVGYVRVQAPTDRTGLADEWPDPLPPLPAGWRPRAQRNNPLWLTVTPPAGARPGVYRGRIVVSGAGWRSAVPIMVRVRDFTIPARASLRSGFGISPDSLRTYHRVRTAEDLARVWDGYMRSFARHRISPYNPMALAPYEVTLTGREWAGGERDRTRVISGSHSLRIDDASTTASVGASSIRLSPVTPGRRYTLSWFCIVGAGGQSHEVSVGCYDAARRWIPYHNIDLTRIGDGFWQPFAVEIGDRLPPEARFVSITLRPVVWTEGGANTGSAWFDDISLREEPHGPNLIADGSFEEAGEPHVRIDFTAFDREARRYLDGMGFNAFTINFLGLPGGRAASVDHGAFLGFAPGTPDFDRLMTEYGHALQDHLERNGWLNKAYVYWYDEPEVGDYPIVREGAARLKRYAPKLVRMLTEQPEGRLADCVDLWCPITPEYRRAATAARQAKGEEVWWYVCTAPKDPYCTLFIDHPAVELRVWLWQAWINRVQGFLIWETAWWTSPQAAPGVLQDPWTDPMSYVAADTGVWGNGDGRFFYPPAGSASQPTGPPILAEPVETIRWEMLGVGVQDWECFRILSERVAARERAGDRSREVRAGRALLTVPRSVCTDMTAFARDPRALLAHRERVADAIERLGGVTR